MTTYVSNEYQNEVIVFYSNHNNASLQCDGLVSSVLKSLNFNSVDENKYLDAGIVFLHGEYDYPLIKDHQPLTLSRLNKTLFVLFCHAGFPEENPTKIIGPNGEEHLAIFLRRAPFEDRFSVEDWKRLIEWTVSRRKKIEEAESIDVFLNTCTSEDWYSDVKFTFPEHLLSSYLLGLAKKFDPDFDVAGLPEDLLPKALAEYKALEGTQLKTLSMTSLEDSIPEIKKVLEITAGK